MIDRQEHRHVAGAQRGMADAPKDGTRILAWMQPEPVRDGPRSHMPPPRYVLVRWFGTARSGHWSTHPKGQGRVRGDLLAWWALPERRAS